MQEEAQPEGPPYDHEEAKQHNFHAEESNLSGNKENMEKSKDSDMDYSDMQQMKNVSKSKLFQKFMKK